jgi:hypothetical protein
MVQRWLVGSSEAAVQRAEATVSKAQPREDATILTHLVHLQAQRFETPEAAHAALAAVAQAWTYHQGDVSPLLAHQHDACQGRPASTTPIKAIDWQSEAQVRPDDVKLGHLKRYQACCVLGTTIETRQLSDVEGMQAYKAQGQVEGGCRLLKDPLFVVSALVVKKPSRIQGLLTVMT